MLDEAISPGISLLYAGWLQARAANSSPWDFAVADHVLGAQGVDDSEVATLLVRGYVACRPGRARRGDRAKGGAATGSQTLAVQFVLTDAGAAWVESFSGALARRPAEPEPARPTWDREQRVLRWGAKIIKEYRQPASAQECLLVAFEEQNWARRMDDPLPQVTGVNPKQRLHDTVKNLNRHHRVRIVLFYGDGTGEGVCWRLVDGL
jgi:hypothetical protein